MKDVVEKAKYRLCAPKWGKFVSNLTWKQRVADWWHRFLERKFAPGCYYAGTVSSIDNIETEEGKTVLKVTQSSQSAHGGRETEFALVCGGIFFDSIVRVPFLWKKLYFSKPIKIEGTDVRIAIGTRSFVDGTNLVLKKREHGSTYRVHVPDFIGIVLQNVEFATMDGREMAGCRIISNACHGEKAVSCGVSVSDPSSDVVNIALTVKETESVFSYFPLIKGSAEDAKKLPPMVQRRIGKYLVGIGDKTELVDGDKLVLAFGETVLSVKKEESAGVLQVLDELNRLIVSRPVMGGLLEEIFCGDGSIYLLWHRGRDISVFP